MFNSPKDWSEMFNDLNKTFTDLTEKSTEIKEKWNSQDKSKKDVVANHLSKEELIAFKGLCALEGITESEKMADLIKRYLMEKRNNL